MLHISTWLTFGVLSLKFHIYLLLCLMGRRGDTPRYSGSAFLQFSNSFVSLSSLWEWGTVHFATHISLVTLGKALRHHSWIRDCYKFLPGTQREKRMENMKRPPDQCEDPSFPSEGSSNAASQSPPLLSSSSSCSHRCSFQILLLKFAVQLVPNKGQL